MIEAKCFTFFTRHRFHKSDITSITESDLFPIIKIQDTEVSPFVKFTCTNPEIGESESEEMLQGYFIELFENIKNKITKESDYFILDSTFILQFDTDDPVSLINDEIHYAQEDYVYTYKISPSLSKSVCPRLSESIDIEHDQFITIEEAIKTKIR